MDVEKVHARLEEELAERTQMTGSVLMHALDRAQENYMDAAKLKNRARREYELFKIEHETWKELKKTAARGALEVEKEAGKLKKQITKDMIEDAVLSTWPTEYRKREGMLRDFQAAVHTLEGLLDAWKARARTLSDLKDLVLAFGVGSRR